MADSIITKVNSYWDDKYDDDNDDEGYCDCDDPRPSRRDAAAQPPKVLWTACADSPFPKSVDPHPATGNVFVYRNMANQFRADDSSALAVLEHAVHTLKVYHVVVEGYTDCACIQASIEAAHTARAAHTDPAAPTTPLARWLAPLTVLAAGFPPPDSLRKRALLLVEQGVAVQVAGVVRALGALQPLDRPVHVHGLVYDLEQRELDLDVSVTVGGGGDEAGAAGAAA
ncbi:hypothetical protein HETIRDRAFT_451835 [Heterobasidion irregulare TC 32-1]|uniref:Carbonic anhydrase n=1 Tax=Heterobasidion irregulare (strain TC 32-1) TaxID=747525 RepID=W4K8Z0_HETIT|nr:uncharacterized protein HETIRDRAFT_451835 [Heterobasidion irregulare TC 32-1]ETW82282.1 hypothetical protein HETIRDRAFT_451835 [Heterobasidion irregulare TC 32-1]